MFVVGIKVGKIMKYWIINRFRVVYCRCHMKTTLKIRPGCQCVHSDGSVSKRPFFFVLKNLHYKSSNSIDPK